MEKIVVSDTNIFIDLYSVGLLNEFFALNFDIHTTDFVINELVVAEQRSAVLSFEKLRVKRFDSKEIAKLFSFYSERHSKTNVSLPDCSVLMYAEDNGYMLLTGDGKLRRVAIEEGTEVRGVLYIFDKLVEDGLLSPNGACEKLQMLRKLNGRLPSKEIEKRLEYWAQIRRNAE